MQIIVRDALQIDIQEITAIYNHSIRYTTSVYSEEVVSLINRNHWFDNQTKNNFPILVAECNEEVLGFASYNQFRSWPGYKFTVEHSVHIQHNHQRKGIATKLLESLITRAKANNIHSIIGGIDAANKGSIALHEKLGFKQVALIPEAGYKFNKWLDLVLMQRLI